LTCLFLIYVRSERIYGHRKMQQFNRIPTQDPEDTELTRDSVSEVNACLCIVFSIVTVLILVTTLAYVFSPSQAMIPNMEIQRRNNCANRCCYSRMSNTYSRPYGILSSSKVYRVQANYGCTQCPDQRQFDYEYDCNVSPYTYYYFQLLFLFDYYSNIHWIMI